MMSIAISTCYLFYDLTLIIGKRVRACGSRKVEIFPHIWHPEKNNEQHNEYKILTILFEGFLP
jgi:hypothetical protein